ncbi:MAG: hypothetical protein JW990_04120 [Thermoleophilia bacterium]|nr:hypothetical protein [Thermoleophilia bacterium]
MLKTYADKVLQSMVAHDPSMLPLASRYAATENSVAGSLNMLSGWRTVTGVNRIGQYIVDEPAGQIFFTANVDESGSPTLLWARLKVLNGELTELEMYTARARSDGGFAYLVDEIGTLPNGWSAPIPEGGKATRAELLHVAQAIFDSSLPVPDAAPDCFLMELGGVVMEDPEYEDLLWSGEIKQRDVVKKEPIPMGLPPVRPSDPNARVAVIDEDQGIVVSIGLVPGFVSPYVVRSATESCFVPAAMIEMHHRTLRPEMFPGRSVLFEMPAVSVTCQVVRMHSGLIQGTQLFNKLQGPGGGTPWVAS